MISKFLALTMFGSFTVFCLLTLILFMVLLFSEDDENGLIGAAAIIVYSIINHFWGNVPIASFISWINISIYLGLGFVYSIIKTYFYGRGMISITNNDLNELRGNVFRWWFLWPISLIYWLISDLIKQLWAWIFDKLSSNYERILKAGFNSKK